MTKFVLLLEASREGYSLDQIGRTMTAGELIAYLEDFDEDTPVAISNDNGYTYGAIRESAFRSGEMDEDE